MSTPSTPPTPSRPGRRRASTGIRRPRVAGQVPGRPGERPEPTPAGGIDLVGRDGDAATGVGDTARDTAGDTVTDAVRDTPAEVADGEDLFAEHVPAESDAGSAEPAAPRPSGKRALRRRGATVTEAGEAKAPRRPVPTMVLAAVAALLLAVSAFFVVQNVVLRGTPAAQNTALTDVGATAQVTQQVSDALTKVYSFDYTRLDQNEAAAKSVITPAFTAQYETLFKQVRDLAPQQKAVVTATVNVSAVRSITGDTATMLVFLDQQATRVGDGGKAQQLAAPGRLTVTAERVDGTWQIANVVPN